MNENFPGLTILITSLILSLATLLYAYSLRIDLNHEAVGKILDEGCR